MLSFSVYVLSKARPGAGYVTAWYSPEIGCTSLAVSDRDHDGIQEIYAGTQTEQIYIFRGDTFAQIGRITLPEQPLRAAPLDTGIFGLAVAAFGAGHRLKIALLESTRTLVYDANTLALAWNAEGMGSYALAIAQVDNDAETEIIANGEQLHILDAATGREKWSSADRLGYDMLVADLDGDGVAEIVYCDYKMSVYDGRTHTMRTLVEAVAPNIDSATIATLGGSREIPGAVRDGIQPAIRAYRASDGQLVWERQGEEGAITDLTLADTDNDGRPELVWGQQGVLTIADAQTGAVKWRSDSPLSPDLVAAGDLNGDGHSEVVVLGPARYAVPVLTILDGPSRRLLRAVPLRDWDEVNYLAVAQLDDDPQLEIVVGGQYLHEDIVRAYDGLTQDGQPQWESQPLGMTDRPSAWLVQSLGRERTANILAVQDANKVEVFDGASPVILWDGPQLDSDIQDMAAGDLDGDGVVDLAVLTKKSLYVFETHTWTQRTRQDLPWGTHLAIQAAQGGRPGQLLIASTTSEANSSPALLQAWAGDTFHVLWATVLGAVTVRGLVSVDADSDGVDEFILFGVTGNVPGDDFSFNPSPSLLQIGVSANGPSWKYRNTEDWGMITGLALADLDADKQKELLFISHNLIQINRVIASSRPLATPTPSGARYFPETGKTVSGRFLEYWTSHGGLAQQGYPISDAFQERNPTDDQFYMVQYFERAVFELHSQNQAPYDVLLSLLGTFHYQEQYPRGAPGQVPNTAPGSVFFAQPGHRLGGRFLAYWQSHGGLAQQGYPISDEFPEKSDMDGQVYRVQYFQRAVFEWHPANRAPYDVLLSQLGTYRLHQLYPQGLAAR